MKFLSSRQIFIEQTSLSKRFLARNILPEHKLANTFSRSSSVSIDALTQFPQFALKSSLATHSQFCTAHCHFCLALFGATFKAEQNSGLGSSRSPQSVFAIGLLCKCITLIRNLSTSDFLVGLRKRSNIRGELSANRPSQVPLEFVSGPLCDRKDQPVAHLFVFVSN